VASEPRFLYSVRSSFSNHEIRAEFIAWLAGGHLADVVKAGALAAELVEFEPESAPEPGRTPDAPGDVESRYHFASREAYEAYAAGPAVALRAEGLARFPPSRGIAMTRGYAVSSIRVP
jgi:hypothetical protein